MKRTLFLLLMVLSGCPDRTPPPPPPPPPPVAMPAPARPPALNEFIGFSADGAKFRWIAPGTVGDVKYIKTIGVGEAEPQMESLYPEEATEAELKKKLAGFATDRAAPPADLRLVADITATPPTARLLRSGKSVDVPIGKYPYPPSDAAEIWGVSSDGKHAAIHIGGKDVPGLLSKGGGRDFHFFFIAPVP